jgi:hypothetical protein
MVVRNYCSFWVGMDACVHEIVGSLEIIVHRQESLEFLVVRFPDQ